MHHSICSALSFLYPAATALATGQGDSRERLPGLGHALDGTGSKPTGRVGASGRQEGWPGRLGRPPERKDKGKRGTTKRQVSCACSSQRERAHKVCACVNASARAHLLQGGGALVLVRVQAEEVLRTAGGLSRPIGEGGDGGKEEGDTRKSGEGVATQSRCLEWRRGAGGGVGELGSKETRGRGRGRGGGSGAERGEGPARAAEP